MSFLYLHITLAAGATNPTAAFASQKFNKVGFIAPQFDDGSRGIIVCKDLFQNYSMTDGCDNTRKFRASVGLNGGTGVPGSLRYDATYLQNADLQPLIAAGFDVENHSMYHRSGAALDDTVQLDDLIFMYCLYKMQGLIIPTDYLGYTDAAKKRGYLFSTGQGTQTFDSLAPGYNQILPQYAGFYPLVRDFYDDWDTTDLSGQKAAIAQLFTGARNFYVIGTHSPLDTPELLAGFKALYDHIQNTAADRLLVCSVREALEYKQMISLPMTQTLTGNVLSIAIDTTALPDRTRFRDVSLNITGGTIIDVSAEGFTDVSYNAQTGLVNGFFEKRVWGSAALIPDEDQRLNVNYGKYTV